MMYATTIHTLSPNLHQSNPLVSNITLTQLIKPKSYPQKPFTIISCSSSNKKEKEPPITDEKLALELGSEIKKLKTRGVKREEALKKSRELLFTEICGFKGLKTDDLRKKWRRMSEEERLDLAKGFVAEWSGYFHPLSVRSIKEMVEEYLGQDDDDEFGEDGGLFSGLVNFLGFTGNSDD